MDSKLRRMTILSSMAVILLAVLLVFYVNDNRRKPVSDPQQVTPSTEALPEESR